MNLEKGKITRQELVFAMCCFLVGSILRSVFSGAVVGNETFLTVIGGAAAFFPMLWVYLTLMRWFAGQTLFEINDAVFGKIGGKIVSVIYLFFFLTLSALNMMDLGNFVEDFMLPQTPTAAINILMTILCIYAVRRGLQGFMRLAAGIFIFSSAIVLLNFLLLLPRVDFGYLFPLFQKPLFRYIQAAHIFAVIPFGESIAFMAIVPALGREENPAKPMVLGVAVSALFIVVVAVRDVMTLGPLVDIVSLPAFEAVRTVNVARIITRTESFYALVNVSILFFKLCVLFYASVICLAHITGLSQYRPIVGAIGALIACYSLFVFKSILENANWGSSSAPIWSTFFEYLLPLVILIVARVRGLHKKAGVVSG
jgi:spore germination protein KB